MSRDISFIVPDFLNAPWLTKEYVSRNGWVPVLDSHLQLQREYYEEREIYQDTCFGRLPWRSRSEFRPGDIIIFNEYQDAEDRFLYIYEKDIDDYLEGTRELLPVGVVVHTPEVQALRDLNLV